MHQQHEVRADEQSAAAAPHTRHRECDARRSIPDTAEPAKLVAKLRSGNPEVVADATAALRHLGPEASEALVVMQAPGVAATPARRSLELIAQFGDRRALPALQNRLRSCFAAWAAGPAIGAGMLVGAVLLGVIGTFTRAFPSFPLILGGILGIGAVPVFAGYRRSRARRGEVVPAILEAIRGILSRDPCPEVRATLTDFDTITAAATGPETSRAAEKRTLELIAAARKRVDGALADTDLAWEYALRFPVPAPASVVQDHVLRLQSTEPLERAAAAAALSRFGGDGMAPLCRALEDPEPVVRGAAAMALGTVGDRSTIQPLLGALKTSCKGGSARRQYWIGLVLLAAAVLVFLGFVTGLAILKTGGAMSGMFSTFFNLSNQALEKQRRRNRLSGVIVDALLRVAEREPAPELRTVLPEVQALAADFVQQSKDTRALSRKAAVRIEALTEKLRYLPIPAENPAPAAAQLPGAGTAPD